MSTLSIQIDSMLFSLVVEPTTVKYSAHNVDGDAVVDIDISTLPHNATVTIYSQKVRAFCLCLRPHPNPLNQNKTKQTKMVVLVKVVDTLLGHAFCFAPGRVTLEEHVLTTKPTH